MGKTTVTASMLVLVLAALAMQAFAHNIPADKLDQRQIYTGSSENFENPGEVDYEAIVRATPEYASIRKDKVESGSAKYWILISEANNHAIKAISSVSRDGKYDLVVAKGYLSTLDPPIAATDITGEVLKVLGAE